jgi:tRNA uridine 5-carboxymethylaminomethyl modification enzyme
MSAFLRSLARPASGVRAFSTTAQRGVARITIIGNLGGTPELRASSTGREYIRYAVASSSGPVSNRTTSWFNVRAFVPEGPQRDFFLNLPKGYVFASLSPAQPSPTFLSSL